jgi:hypothetical protein
MSLKRRLDALTDRLAASTRTPGEMEAWGRRVDLMTTDELRRELARLEDEEKANQRERDKALAGVVGASAPPETALPPEEPSLPAGGQPGESRSRDDR